MIKLKYIAIASIFVLNTHNAFACEKKIIEKSEDTIIIENLHDACTILEQCSSLPTHNDFLLYKTAANNLAKQRNINSYFSVFSFEDVRQHITKKIDSDDWYKKPFCIIAQQLIQKNPKIVLNSLESMVGFDNYNGSFYTGKMCVFPIALEQCLQNKALIEKANFSKKQLKQEIAPLESESNIPKTDLAPSDYVKYHMMKSKINYINAQENLEDAAVDLALFMKEKYKEDKSYYDENKSYYDLAEKTKTFLDKAESQQSVEDAQVLIDTAKSLPDPYYAVFCTKNENNGYGLTQVHKFLEYKK